jgi:ribose transport system substrate-binding protein
MVTDRHWRRAVAAGAAAFALAACGAGTTSTGTTASTAGVQEAAQKIDQAKKLPNFTPPGTPVAMSRLQGKRVWVMTSTLTVPFVADIARGTMEAAQLVGWRAQLIDGKGDVTEWNRILGEAIGQKVDAVISIASSPEVMKPQMAAAKQAGIPVIDVLTADKDAELVPGTFSHVSISFAQSGQLQADYVIAQSKGKANVLIFGDNEFPAEVTRVKGMQDEFGRLCPACKLTVQDTQVGKLGTDLGPTTQTLLRRDPSIDWVLPTYDAQAVYIVPAIKQAGLQSKVKVVGSDAVPSNLDWTAKSDVQIADVGEPDVWTGWAAVDEMARGMLAMPSVDENIPLRMFDASNLQGVSTSDEDQLWGGSFRAEYRKLWGLS